MSSIKKIKLYNSLRFRLTVWFSLIFTGVFLFIFVIVQVYVRNHLGRITDVNLMEKVKRHIWLGYPGDDSSVDIQDVQERFDFISSKEGISNVFYFYIDSVSGDKAESSMEYWEDIELSKKDIPYLEDKPGKDAIKSFENIKSHKKLKTEVVELDHQYRSHTILQTVNSKGRNDRIRIAYQYFNNHRLFVTGISLQNNKEFLSILQKLLLISYILLLVVVIILVNLLSKKSLAGVEKVKETAIRIGKDNFNYRVPHKNEPTEIQSLAIAFNNMLDRIEQLMREQKAMTRNIAHDLRSPLTSIRGIAETSIGSNNSKQDQEQMAGKIINNCDRLVHMINSMLDISDIETGNFSSKMEELSIQKILDECYETYEPLAEEKQITFINSELDPSIVVKGTRDLLQRAIGNIVGNALKYTDKNGNVTIEATKNHGKIIIRVSDDGIGIPDAEKNRIFERFYRIDKNRSIEGNGLGLSLAKAYIEYQNGRIEVESEQDKGSTFIITLPSR